MAAQALQQFLAARRAWVAARLAAAAAAPDASADDAARVLSEVATQLQARPAVQGERHDARRAIVCTVLRVTPGGAAAPGEQPRRVYRGWQCQERLA